MHYREYKSIISPNGGINIYRGCTHGCIYCDSRSRCYQMQHDFEDIEVKTDAPALLYKELSRKRKKCVIATGAMCDPYIPLEAELQYTRQCLEVIDSLGFGLAIQTKSNLILRDLDVIRSINEHTKAVVEMTLTTFDETLCRIIEPDVCTTAERLRVLRIMRDNGIPTVVWLTPILPFINDSVENMLAILDGCAEAGVKGIICFGAGVTMREGNREYFYKALDRCFPGMRERYMSAFGNSYECQSKINERYMRIFHAECMKRGMASDMGEIFAYIRRFPEKQEQLRIF